MTTPEQTTPEQTNPEQAAREQSSPEPTSPECTTPGQTATKQAPAPAATFAPTKAKPARQRRMARPVSAPAADPPRRPGKLDQIEALLRRTDGASLTEMIAATGWQPHSIRGAMAGALRKRGITITSDKADGTRRYRAIRSV